MKKILFSALTLFVMNGESRAALSTLVDFQIGYFIGHLTSKYATEPKKESLLHASATFLIASPIIIATTNRENSFIINMLPVTLGIFTAIGENLYKDHLREEEEILQRNPRAIEQTGIAYSQTLDQKTTNQLSPDQKNLYAQESCCICSDPLYDNNNTSNKIILTQCKHLYHLECLKENLKHRIKCPICSFNINPESSTIFEGNE